MITVTGLTKHYGDRTAVDDLTFTVAASRVTGFVGPNGAGKSTTMRIMVGLTRPDLGEVRYDGARYTDLQHPARLVGTVLDTRCMHPSSETHRSCCSTSRRTDSTPTASTGCVTTSPTSPTAAARSSCRATSSASSPCSRMTSSWSAAASSSPPRP